MELWFSELHTANVRFSLKVDKQLFSEVSEFQRVDVFDSAEFGRLLVLDGRIMITERDEYDIQLEFGDIANILAYVSVGDRVKDIERLISALADVKRIYRKDSARLMKVEYISPIVDATPKEAFYAEKKSLPIEETVGETSAEFLMCYPPGIPILAPGERITKEILDYIRYAKRKGCQITGPEDMTIQRLQVMA